jgi:prepilin-type N-terminal cleavage/methylation domain-containing protein
MPRPHSTRAFTLLEILITAAIILIIVALVAAAMLKLKGIVNSLGGNSQASLGHRAQPDHLAFPFNQPPRNPPPQPAEQT